MCCVRSSKKEALFSGKADTLLTESVTNVVRLRSLPVSDSMFIPRL